MEIVWSELQREKLGRLMPFLSWSKSGDQSWLSEPQNELPSFLQTQVVSVVFGVVLFNVHEAVRHVGKAGTFQNTRLRGNSCQPANIHFLLAFILSEKEEWLGVFIPLPVSAQPLWKKLMMEPMGLIHRSQACSRETSLPPAEPPPASQPGTRAPVLLGGGISRVLWPWARSSRRGADTLCIDSAVPEIVGSNRKVFAGQIEPGAVLEMGIAGGSRDAMSWPERPLPRTLLLMGRGCSTTEPTSLVLGKGLKTWARSGKQEGECRFCAAEYLGDANWRASVLGESENAFK